jgi:serine protease
VGTAQTIAALPATVSGSISTTADTDYYKVTVPAGKRMLATLTAGSGSGFGMGIYLTSGQPLIVSSGVIGRQQQILVTNSGRTPVSLVVRVLRSSGTAGAYKLAMTI